MKQYAPLLTDDTFAILLFHGVIRRQRHAVRNYTRKHLTLDRFTAIVRSLLERGAPVSMHDVAAGSELPPRAFAVTFDDGFENNYSVAAPVLKELSVPATFYVTTGFIEANSGAWTDMIEYAVEKTPVVRLSLPSISGSFETVAEKIDLLDEVRRVVKNDATIDPYAFAREIWRQVGIAEMEPDDELDAKMSWRQLRELHDDPLFNVGGHGHTHRILSFLSPPELDDEIRGSLAALRRHLDGPVEHYSYPEGLAHCYSEEVIETLKRYGVRCSPTALEGVCRVGDDPFHLKRVWATS